MTDEEREIESLFKNHKLEKWNVGMQKGMTQYVKDTYDSEREQMDKQLLLEQQMSKGDASDTLYDLDDSNQRLAEEEAELNDLSLLHADGEETGDGDEYF
jgi:hypothetical protein